MLNHLKAVGPHDWDEFQKDFPDIPTSSFWRHAKSAKKSLKQDVVLAADPDLFTETNVEISTEQAPWEPQHLNVMFRGLKRAQRLHELYTDALALRKQALHEKGPIQNPGLFLKSVRIREQLLNAEMNVMDSVHSADTATAYMDQIAAAVSRASPETAKEIMDSLHGLQTSWEAKNKRV